jgi:hypothetical protein
MVIRHFMCDNSPAGIRPLGRRLRVRTSTTLSIHKAQRDDLEHRARLAYREIPTPTLHRGVVVRVYGVRRVYIVHLTIRA